MGEPDANWLVGKRCRVRYDEYRTFLAVHAWKAFLPFDCYTLEYQQVFASQARI
jgi:hypothetical protein